MYTCENLARRPQSKEKHLKTILNFEVTLIAYMIASTSATP
jgi:hypothetical protein